MDLRGLTIQEREQLSAEEAAFYELFSAWLEHPFTAMVMASAKEQAEQAGALCKTTRMGDDEARLRVIENQVKCQIMEKIGNGSSFGDVYAYERDRVRRRELARLDIARTQDQTLEGSGLRDGDSRGRSELD